MSSFKSTPKVKVGDKITLTGTIKAIGPGYLGSDRMQALVIIDNKFDFDTELRIDLELIS
jgi:hypothetical protein